MDSWIHPGLIFIFGALLIPLLPGRLRQIYLLVLPAAGLPGCADHDPRGLRRLQLPGL